MPRSYFSGVVLPERAPISISNVQSQIVDNSGKPYASITLNVWLNQITAAVESDETSIHALRNFVKREAECVTDLAGFLLGFGYDTEITKTFSQDLSATHVFGIDVPVLTQRAQGRDLTTLVNAIFPLCFGVEAIYLRRCLTDLSFSLKRLDDTAFYCFRALESLRQSFGPELPEVEQWRAMSAAVRSTKDEIEPLRRHALPARHGLPPPLSDTERQQLFLFTWEIVERYIDFRLIGSGSAPVFAAAAAPGSAPP